MVTAGTKESTLIEKSFKEGPTMRRPILPFMKMLDAGAKIRPSGKSRPKMFLHEDYENEFGYMTANGNGVGDSDNAIAGDYTSAGDRERNSDRY